MPLLPPTFSCACKRTGTGNHLLANKPPHPALLPAGERSKLRDKSQTARGKIATCEIVRITSRKIGG